MGLPAIVFLSNPGNQDAAGREFRGSGFDMFADSMGPVGPAVFRLTCVLMNSCMATAITVVLLSATLAGKGRAAGGSRTERGPSFWTGMDVAS